VGGWGSHGLTVYKMLIKARGGGDFLSEHYRQAACGIAISDTAREACALFVEAEDHLGVEEFPEALRKATLAVDSFRAAGDSRGTADALRLSVLASLGSGSAHLLAEAGRLAWAELERRRAEKDKLGEAKMLVSIAEACTDLEGRGRAEAVTAAKEACAIGKHEGEKRLEVMALLALASVHVAKGSRDKPGAEQALQAASEARELAQDLDDRRKEAESLHAMAEAKAICTSLEDALESADEAMDFYLELKDKRMEAFELLRMASWNLALGQHARALSDAEDALEIYQMLQSPMEVDALRAVFQAHLARSDLRKARLVAAEAFRRFREQGKKEAQVQACTMLIEMYVKADRIDEALSSAQQGLKVCKELGDQARQVSMLVVVARMRFRLAQLSKALVTGRDAFDLMLQLKGSDGKAVSKDKVDLMQVMADSHVNQGDPEAALELVTEMKEHFQQIEDGQGLASSLLLSSILQLRLGKADVATQLANRAQSLFNEEGDMKGEADALKTLGELYWKKSEFKAAVRMGERARALYREVEFTDGELACMYMISENAVRLSVQEGAK
ncbi:unnamed protein product, partial [Polarella glacialis]